MKIKSTGENMLNKIIGLLGLALAGLVCSLPVARAASDGQPFKVLVFSKTLGYRHASITNGIAAIQQIGATNNFEVTASEDATLFTDSGLAPYQVVIFLSTTGEVLNQAQQDAL